MKAHDDKVQKQSICVLEVVDTREEGSDSKAEEAEGREADKDDENCRVSMEPGDFSSYDQRETI